MRLLTTSAITFSLTTLVLGQRPFNNVECKWFDPSLVDQFYLDEHGALDQDVSKAGEVDKYGVRRVFQDKNMGSTAYHYTIHGGIGKFDSVHKDQDVLYAQVDRLIGEGLGQQFKVNYYGENDRFLVSYWIVPQDHCTVGLDLVAAKAGLKSITAADLKKITVSSIKSRRT